MVLVQMLTSYLDSIKKCIYMINWICSIRLQKWESGYKTNMLLILFSIRFKRVDSNPDLTPSRMVWLWTVYLTFQVQSPCI